MDGNDFKKIDDYLTSLNDRLNKSYNEDVLDEVKSVLDVIDNTYRKENLKRILRFCGILVLIFGLLVLYWDQLYIYFVYLARFLIITLKPIIDLTVLYQEKCLFKNPNYIEESRINFEMCEKTCLKYHNFILNTFDKSNLTQDVFLNTLVFNDLPFIDKSEINNNWKSNNLTIKQIGKIYLKQLHNLKDNDFCYFDSTHFIDKGILNFFEDISTKHFKKISAKWENCQSLSSKILRRFTQRPYFLPTNIEIVSQNWFIISKGIEHEYNIAPVSLRYMMFCQLIGETKIKLTSVTECENICAVKKLNLKAGEILFFTDMWNIEYKSVNNDENISILLLAR